MDNIEVSNEEYKQARRHKSKAHNDLNYHEHQAKRQQLELDGLLRYKDECIAGLATAKEKGLPPMHMRELELLMTHIDSAIETLAYKVDSSQVGYEKAKEVWQEKNKAFEVMKELIKQQELRKAEQAEERFAELERSDAERRRYYGPKGNSIAKK